MHVRHDRVFVYVARPDESGVSHEFLQLRRIGGGELAGSWGTIAGEVRDDEPAWKAGAAILREKAGLAQTEFYRVNRVSSFFTPPRTTRCGTARCSSRRCEKDAPVVLGTEHDAIRWADRKYVDTLFLWPDERTTLAQVCSEILDDGPARAYLRIQDGA